MIADWRSDFKKHSTAILGLVTGRIEPCHHGQGLLVHCRCHSWCRNHQGLGLLTATSGLFTAVLHPGEGCLQVRPRDVELAQHLEEMIAALLVQIAGPVAQL